MLKRAETVTQRVQLVKLAGAEGRPVWVNPANVTCVEPLEDGALVTVLGGGTVQVTDNAERAVQLLMGELYS
ncbi:MAG: hypothetical protein KC583_20735 [Myxococcales bacterium]|nr:hypothetical protein [Myxococcales bacterium]